ncbi:MAG: ribonuclease J [Patescibacteria group bacterium]
MSKNEKEKVKITPLGGLGEVGKNMTLLEYEGQILIIDMGLSFPEDENPGVDYIIPNISYLKGRKDDILGVIFTHGHYDHIGAVPYFLNKLGNPPLFASSLTMGIIEKRQDDFPNQPKLNKTVIEDGSKIELGPFKIEAFHQNHNIPQNLGYFIETPVGNILHTSDFKFDEHPQNGPATNYEKIKEFGNRGIHLMLSDSTGAEEEGHSLSEKTISENIEKIFQRSDGRIITATFSSLINRVQDIIELSEKYGRKVIIEGYGMKTNVELAINLGLIKASKNTFVDRRKADSVPPEKTTIICTGAQGEERAALMRITQGQHRFFELQERDTVVFSSSVIPGNERSVQNLRDDILRQGADIYHYKMMDIHASGHGCRDELREMIEMVKPNYLVPVHGQYSMMVRHKELAEETNIPQKTILIENGDPLEMTSQKVYKTGEQINTKPVMVDGSGVGDVGGVVLYDRKELAESGIFVVIVVLDKKTKKLQNSPDIISRGFVYLRESQDLLAETRKKTRNIVKEASKSRKTSNAKHIKKEMEQKIEDFLYSKTRRRPIVLPVVIEV